MLVITMGQKYWALISKDKGKYKCDEKIMNYKIIKVLIEVSA